MIYSQEWSFPSDGKSATSLFEYLRDCGLIGGRANIYGGPDELFLLSGGPNNQDSNLTLIAGPPLMRCVANQPSITKQPPSQNEKSAISGNIDFSGKKTTCNWKVEEWCKNRGWTSRLIIEGEDLSSSLRSLTPLLPDESDDSYSIIPGGFAGLLTYDLVQWTEPARLKHLPPPSTLIGILLRVDRWIIHNREEGILTLLSLYDDDWFTNSLDSISDWIDSSRSELIQTSTYANFSSTISDNEHSEVVDIVREGIKKGDFYQLNYGRKWSGEIKDPWFVFKRLIESNPAPYSGWLLIPDYDYALASVSPELLLSLSEGVISTRPIKGTRPRGRKLERDEANKRELVSSRKEISEHMMLVDLERNDLSKVCRVGSVKWHDWRIESHPNVHHLVSEIRGKLRSDCDSWDVIQAIFPGGSITGCPKTATIAAIDELEHSPRGAWTGSLGLHDPRTGYACWNILIRTLEAKFSPSSGWIATVQAGGGLVFESDSIQEVEEAKWKAQALLDAAWGFSETKIPNQKMSISPVPIVNDRIENLTKSLTLQEQVCIAPFEPICWAPKDAPFPMPEENSRRVLFVDNLDSFSWNIVHSCAKLGAEVIVVNGRDGLAETNVDHILQSIKPTHVILGPGPGKPSSSPLTQTISNMAINGKLRNINGEKISLLGICLGHQAIGEAAGWKLIESPLGAVHGVPSNIIIEQNEIFTRFDSNTIMMRYHSLVVVPTNNDLDVIGTDQETQSLVMALSHPINPVWGVQFHPESCGSLDGWLLLDNFLLNSNTTRGQSVEVPMLSRGG